MLERLNADRDAVLEVLLEWRRDKATRLSVSLSYSRPSGPEPLWRHSTTLAQPSVIR